MGVGYDECWVVEGGLYDAFLRFANVYCVLSHIRYCVYWKKKVSIAKPKEAAGTNF